MNKKTISLYVDVEDPHSLAKVSEQFARALAGLAMENIYGTVDISPSWDCTDEED